MHHDVAVLHGRAHAMRITDVSRKDLDRLLDSVVGFVEPAPGVEAVVVNEGAHLGAEADKVFCQV